MCSPWSQGRGCCWLWDAACAIRGAVDAPKFKDYILPLIFIKRLSDVFEDELAKLAGPESFGDVETAWEMIEAQPELVRFFIPRHCMWPEIRKLTKEIGQNLTDVIRDIADQNERLQGVIDIVDFNATVSGERIIPDERLSALIEIISRHKIGLDETERKRSSSQQCMGGCRGRGLRPRGLWAFSRRRRPGNPPSQGDFMRLQALQLKRSRA